MMSILSVTWPPQATTALEATSSEVPRTMTREEAAAGTAPPSEMATSASDDNQTDKPEKLDVLHRCASYETGEES